MSVGSLSGLGLGSLQQLLRQTPERQNSSEVQNFRLDPPEEREDQKPRSEEGLFGLEALQSQANIARSIDFSASRTEFDFSSNGLQVSGFSEQLSFAANFQQGDQTFQLNIEVTRSVVGIASTGAGQGGFDFESLLDRLPDEARELVESFSNGELAPDFFSPESTANRILDFALGGFGFFEGGAAAAENSDESRQRFVDFIAPAIQQGFEEALEILGELPQSIASELEETRSLIEQGLTSFAQERTDQEV